MASRSQARAPTGAAATLIAWLLLAALPAVGQDLSVYPVRIELRPERPAETVVLSNRAARDLRFEVSYQAWSMSADGQWQYADSDALLVHPLLLTVPAGGSASLRVGSLLPHREDGQHAWRLFVQQLPEPQETAGVQVQLLTRLSLPVFYGRGDETPQPRVDAAEVEDDTLLLELANEGDAYLGPGPLILDLLDSEGRVLDTVETSAGYILPGARLPLAVTLPAGVCGRVHGLTVDWPDASARLSAPVSGRGPACRR